MAGDFLIGPATHPKKLQAHQTIPLPAATPVGNLFGHRLDQSGLLKVMAFTAAGDRAGSWRLVGWLPCATGVARSQRNGGPPPGAAKMVGELVRGDRKQIAFQRLPRVV